MPETLTPAQEALAQEPATALAESAREELGKVRRYFEGNPRRVGYPEYEREGWQIGSGAVESACKTVVGQRLEGAGMRSGEAGAHALCHARALLRGERGQWGDSWKGRFSGEAPVHQLI